MHTKMCIHYSLIRRLGSYKVAMFVFHCVVSNSLYCRVCLFPRDQIFADFVSFLSMIMYEILFIMMFKVKYLQHLVLKI